MKYSWTDNPIMRLPKDHRQLCLDIGNVVCHLNFDPICELFIKYDHARNDEGAMSVLNQTQHNQDVGLSDIDQYFTNDMHVPPSLLPEFMKAWDAVVVPEVEIMKFVNDLVEKNEDLNVYLLSNIGYRHASLLRNMHPEFFKRHHQHFSCEVGARKPFKLFYQSFFIENNFERDEIFPWYEDLLFLDDRQENVDMANKLGMTAQVFTLEGKSRENAVKEFKDTVMYYLNHERFFYDD